MIKLNRNWLFLIFPILYGVPVLFANLLDSHNARASLGYIGFILTIPSSIFLNFETDPYNHIASLVIGTIQWGIIFYSASNWISNLEDKPYDGF